MLQVASWCVGSATVSELVEVELRSQNVRWEKGSVGRERVFRDLFPEGKHVIYYSLITCPLECIVIPDLHMVGF